MAASSRNIIPNVQLSPRSAAFVTQNNVALNRRKAYGSPDRDRSRSPVTPPSRYTPGRWSASPPPYKNVKLRSNYEHRSNSRDKSPHIFRRSSPPPLPPHNSKSPPPMLRKSRSPMPLKVRKSPPRKSLSPSPHRTGNDRHASSPYTRTRSPGRYGHSQKNYRRYSPTQHRSYNRKHLNARRSPSPRNNGHYPLKQRSKSPPPSSKRSRSKSPNNRNYQNRSNRGERVNKRRSPVNNRKSNNNKSSHRSKRKLSPTPTTTTTHRSASPENRRKVEKSSQPPNIEDKKPLPAEEKTKIEKNVVRDATVAENKTEPPTKSAEDIENELLASSDDDKSSDENEDDGIDLFASEESESENEGRFKSNSSKNVRSNTATTVSFSKLGNATTSALGDLSEIKSDKSAVASSHREDRYKRSSNYNSRRDDRSSRKRGSSRNDDSRYGDSRSSYKSRYVSSTASVAAPQKVAEDSKKKDDKSMFKSTFQVLSNEMKSGEFARRTFVSNGNISGTESIRSYRSRKVSTKTNGKQPYFTHQRESRRKEADRTETTRRADGRRSE